MSASTPAQPLEVVLASGNRHKLAELARILEGVPVVLRSNHELGLGDVEETGVTFADNALLKARAAHAATGLPAIADDSGLVVDALDGAPGVRSARYAGEHGDDAANLELVLERMADVSERSARFVCAAALVSDRGEWVREGALEGTLTTTPRGSEGFGYDPILVPAPARRAALGIAEERTCAELAPEQKDALSHRGEAFRALRPLIEGLV